MEGFSDLHLLHPSRKSTLARVHTLLGKLKPWRHLQFLRISFKRNLSGCVSSFYHLEMGRYLFLNDLFECSPKDALTAKNRRFASFTFYYVIYILSNTKIDDDLPLMKASPQPFHEGFLPLHPPAPLSLGTKICFRNMIVWLTHCKFLKQNLISWPHSQVIIIYIWTLSLSLVGPRCSVFVQSAGKSGN